MNVKNLTLKAMAVSLLLSSAAGANPVRTGSDFDPVADFNTKVNSESHSQVVALNTDLNSLKEDMLSRQKKEDRWQSDYDAALRDSVVSPWQYIGILFEKDAEAATWFSITGGKNGFSKRQATDQEYHHAVEAMRKVAKNSIDGNPYQKGEIERYRSLGEKFKAVANQLNFVDALVKDLQNEIKHLNTRVSSLESDLGLEKAERKLEVSGLKSEVARLTKDLIDERAARKGAIKALQDRLDKSEETVADLKRQLDVKAKESIDDRIEKLNLINEGNLKAERETHAAILKEHQKQAAAKDAAKDAAHAAEREEQKKLHDIKDQQAAKDLAEAAAREKLKDDALVVERAKVEAEKKVIELEGKKTTLEERVTALSAQKEFSEYKLERAITEKTQGDRVQVELRDHIGELDRRKVALEQEILEVRNSLSIANNRLIEFHQEVRNLNSTIDDLKANNTQLKGALSTSNINLEKERKVAEFCRLNHSQKAPINPF